MRNRNRTAQFRCGNTLIEVMVGCVLASALLVPSLSLLVDAMKWSGRIELKKEMLLLADSQMANIRFRVTEDFHVGNLQGSFADQGFPEIRYVARWSTDEAVDNTGHWMSINLLVWWDRNQNGSVEANETQHTLQSGTARRT